MSSSNPVLVEIWRGEMVDSRHEGPAAIIDAAGRVVESWGDIGRPVFARSAVKPLPIDDDAGRASEVAMGAIRAAAGLAT